MLFSVKERGSDFFLAQDNLNSKQDEMSVSGKVWREEKLDEKGGK